VIASLSAALLLVASVYASGGVNEMYADEELAREKPRYERRLREIFSAGLWAFMDGPEKQALSGVRIDVPLKGESPLDAHAYLNGSTPTVVLPALTLKFIEDLSVAYAWRHVHRYSLEPMDEYVAMLKYRRPADFPGGRVPDPRSALGVPARILEQDSRVDDLSLRFRNTAWAFILAHELGHQRFRHAGNLRVAPEVSQSNERAADAFAVDLLSRSDTIPMGMILWLQATTGYFPNRADFASEAEYRTWTRSSATHPVNPERLQHLGTALNRAARASLNREFAEVVPLIASHLVGMGDILAEPDMQRLIARCAVLGRPEDLKRLHDRPCDDLSQ
jgi:hypothetical protein